MRHLTVIGIVLLAACASPLPSGPSDVRGRTVARENCPGAYPAQESSAYVLPYEPGRSFVVGTGNCGGSHPRGEWAEYHYDFLMPIGTPVVAARDGDVIVVVERFANGTRTSGEGNGIRVLHADGTIAMYWHLTTNGALVEVGDRVKQGQIIGLSGESGDATAPHLHFGVSAPCPACSTTSLAVTFRNTRPHLHGLVTGESYRAE